jgi:WD40 repeat protein
MKSRNASKHLRLIPQTLFSISLLVSIMGTNLVGFDFANANTSDFQETKISGLERTNLSLNKQDKKSTPDTATNFSYTLQKQHTYDVNSLVFTPDGKTLISGSAYNPIHIWDLKSRKLLKLLDAGKDGVNTLSVSNDGSLLASGGGFAQPETDKMIKIWNLKTCQVILTLIGHTQGVSTLRFTPDGKYLISASFDQTIRIWDLKSGKSIRTLAGHKSWVMALALSSDGKVLASAGGDYEGENDTTIRLWEIKTGKLLRTITGSKGAIAVLTFTPDNKMLISSSGSLITNEQTTDFWDINSGKLVKSLPLKSISLMFSPDGKNLLTVGSSYGVDLWNIQDRKKVATLVEPANDDHGQNSGRIYLSSATLSPDGKTLAIGEGGVLSGYRIGIRQIRLGS